MKTYRVTDGQRQAAAQADVKATPAASRPLTSTTGSLPWDEVHTSQVGLPTQTSGRTPVRPETRALSNQSLDLAHLRDLLDRHFARLPEYDQEFMLSVTACLEQDRAHRLTARQQAHLGRILARMRLMDRYHA